MFEAALVVKCSLWSKNDDCRSPVGRDVGDSDVCVCVDWQKGERKIEDDAANIVF